MKVRAVQAFAHAKFASILKIALAYLVVSGEAISVDMARTYLDQAASFSVDENALEEFLKTARLDGNSSGINSHAKYLKSIEENAAKTIVDKINAKHDQIHFTCSATVANNIAILGVANKYPACRLTRL